MKNIQPTPWMIGYSSDGVAVLSDVNSNLIAFNNPTREHIVKCINACAGMDDPVAEVEKLRADLEAALIDHNDTLRGVVNKLREETDLKFVTDCCNAASKNVLDRVKSKKGIGQDSPYFMTQEATIGACMGEIKITDREEARKIADSCLHDFSNVKNYGGVAKIPSWHELGELPPVNVQCMHGDDIVQIVAHMFNGENKYAAFQYVDGNGCGYSSARSFRPLQTEKQKTIKEMLPILSNFYGSQNKEELAEACEKIYDKFIAKKAE